MEARARAWIALVPYSPRVTRRVLVLVGAVVFVALLGIGVADYTRAQSGRDDARAAAERHNDANPCNEPDFLTATPEQKRAYTRCLASRGFEFEDPDAEAAAARKGWERRRVWYGFGLVAIAVLTPAAALVLPRRE
jgi:hypothetical protein